MSLINKMLQDLDARGARAGLGPQFDVKSVPGRARRPGLALWLAAAALLAALAGGALAWHFLSPQKNATQWLLATPKAPLMQVLLPAVTGPAPVQAMPTAPRPVPVISPAPATLQLAAPATLAQESARTIVKHPETAASQLPVLKAASKSRSDPAGGDRGSRRADTPGTQSVLSVSEPAQRKEASPRQGAENAYRKALSSLQEGRVRTAIDELEQALQLDPRHDAARQTLIGLFIENKRLDEAMQQLQQGLTLDPAQTSLAMALARLRVEKGGPALDVLLHSLPYATQNAEYQAFVAALLQREERHKEAAGHYEAALRLSPQNGIWWMGLGISLQADQRWQDAINAYRRAAASGMLSPELRSFVEQRLQQLAR